MMEDFVGNTIRVGDTVVYPVKRYSATPRLKKGVVTALGTDGVTVKSEENTRLVTLQPERMAVVQNG